MKKEIFLKITAGLLFIGIVFCLVIRGQTPIGVYSTGIPGAVIMSPTNFAFTLVQTNFVSGQLYTNTYGNVIEVRANAVLTPASVAGAASMSLLSSGYQTNWSSIQTLIGTLAMPQTNVITMWIPAGNTYTFTNLSAGAGDSASVLGGQILVY